jgi:hypothetical protein
MKVPAASAETEFSHENIDIVDVGVSFLLYALGG